MPLLWKTLLSLKSKFFSVVVIATMGLLFVARSTEIAKIAVMGNSLFLGLEFALLHIPVFIPLSIPIAVLASSFLIQRYLIEKRIFFSLLSSGFSLSKIFFPLIMSSALLGMVNLFCVSELATLSWHRAKNLPYRVAQNQPMQLISYNLEQKHKGASIPSHLSSHKSALFFLPENSSSLMGLFYDDLTYQDQMLTLSNIDTIHYVEKNGSEHILADHRDQTQLGVHHLNTYLPEIKNSKLDYFSLATLINNPTHAPIEEIFIEVVRRLFWGLLVVSFCSAGLALASPSTIWYRSAVLFSCTVSLTSLFFACSFTHLWMLGLGLMVLCQGLCLSLSIYKLTSLKKGALG